MPNIIKDAQRIDKALIIGSIKKTDDGYLQGNAVVARSGILEYYENGKVVRELVTDEELARADSLVSLKMKPVTNGHPSVKLVTSQNVKQFQVGFTGENVVCEDGRLVTPITINDNVAITDVEVNKRRQLSCGYICDEIEEPGVWNGQPYDRKQTNRRYNHVALCDHARAGSVASLHLDASDVYECGEPDFKGDGGPGSGNFGHSGRPGEQGGSGEGDGGGEKHAVGKVISHEGRSYQVHTHTTIMGSRIAYASEVEPIDGHYQPVSFQRSERAKNIEIELKSGKITKLDNQPPQRSRPMDFKGDGGPGSGNFGHSGRPGEQGGSGEGVGGEAEKDTTYKAMRRTSGKGPENHYNEEVTEAYGKEVNARIKYVSVMQKKGSAHPESQAALSEWHQATAHFQNMREKAMETFNTDSIDTNFQRSRPMPVTIKIDGIDYPDQAPEVLKRLEKLDAEIATAKTSVTTIQTKLDAMTADRDATKVKLDAANAEIATFPTKVVTASKARADLVAIAKPRLDKVDADKIDTLSDVQIKKSVALKAFPASKEKIDAVKEDALDAVNTWFDAAIEHLKNDGFDAAARQNRQDSVGSDKVHVDGCQCDGCVSNGKSEDINEHWKKNKEDAYTAKKK